ncbi:MAG: malonic semialdehyde reductase [Alphaproteobacteria bacterium]
MLTQGALDVLFRKARTYNAWKPQEIPDGLLQQIYELAVLGPTSLNCCPMRVLFLKSKEAKEKLKPALAPGNVDKTMEAPVTVVIAHDQRFYDKLPVLFPHLDARSWFVDNKDLASETAFRNGTLQGAYFILAARSMGLDCGPMSGFDKDMVDQLFFADRPWKSNFLCNVGYGNAEALYPRGVRPSFDEACYSL